MLHRYTTSEFSNLKWFIKRTIRASDLDRLIFKHIQTYLERDHNILNLGSGLWTPYDTMIRKKSKKLINCDTTHIARIFHPFTLKKILVDDINLYEIIPQFNIDAILCFHSISFIHIDLPNFINFCVDNRIRLLFDWSVQAYESRNENISKYCYGEGVRSVFKQIKAHDLILLDTENGNRVREEDDLRVGGRYLFSSHDL